MGCDLSMHCFQSLMMYLLADLMDALREIPGREALKLRAEASPRIFSLYFHLFLNFMSNYQILMTNSNEFLSCSICGALFYQVASMASVLKKQRVTQDKRIMRISDLGVPV